MKQKEIEFNAEELVGSVEAFAAHVQGRKKLTLRGRQLSLPPPDQTSPAQRHYGVAPSP
jgi:hypothetical protein